MVRHASKDKNSGNPPNAPPQVPNGSKTSARTQAHKVPGAISALSPVREETSGHGSRLTRSMSAKKPTADDTSPFAVKHGILITPGAKEASYEYRESGESELIDDTLEGRTAYERREMEDLHRDQDYRDAATPTKRSNAQDSRGQDKGKGPYVSRSPFSQRDEDLHRANSAANEFSDEDGYSCEELLPGNPPQSSPLCGYGQQSRWRSSSAPIIIQSPVRPVLGLGEDNSPINSPSQVLREYHAPLRQSSQVPPEMPQHLPHLVFKKKYKGDNTNHGRASSAEPFHARDNSNGTHTNQRAPIHASDAQPSNARLTSQSKSNSHSTQANQQAPIRASDAQSSDARRTSQSKSNSQSTHANQKAPIRASNAQPSDSRSILYGNSRSGQSACVDAASAQFSHADQPTSSLGKSRAKKSTVVYDDELSSESHPPVTDSNTSISTGAHKRPPQENAVDLQAERTQKRRRVPSQHELQVYAKRQRVDESDTDDSEDSVDNVVARKRTKKDPTAQRLGYYDHHTQEFLQQVRMYFATNLVTIDAYPREDDLTEMMAQSFKAAASNKERLFKLSTVQAMDSSIEKMLVDMGNEVRGKFHKVAKSLVVPLYGLAPSKFNKTRPGAATASIEETVAELVKDYKFIEGTYTRGNGDRVEGSWFAHESIGQLIFQVYFSAGKPDGAVLKSLQRYPPALFAFCSTVIMCALEAWKSGHFDSKHKFAADVYAPHYALLYAKAMGFSQKDRYVKTARSIMADCLERSGTSTRNAKVSTREQALQLLEENDDEVLQGMPGGSENSSEVSNSDYE